MVPPQCRPDVEMAQQLALQPFDGMMALAIDPEKARAYRNTSQPYDTDVCTMCGDQCAVKRSRRVADILNDK